MKVTPTWFVFCIVHQLATGDDVLACPAVAQLALFSTAKGIDLLPE